MKYRPDLDGFVTTNHKGATGSGIALLERIGAGTVDMGEIQIHLHRRTADFVPDFRIDSRRRRYSC
ncbi:hypothetical protein LNP26_26415 [Klebsiella variicola subsp. variicola]|nr:hypothetical protein [Klebsiella variicola subsp. variicola]